jgi:L-alanine-DL-glutamate epimerase-like enolase superfamily enzyme
MATSLTTYRRHDLMMGSAIERGDRDLTGDDEDAAITSIATYALAVPLARPIADSTAALSHWIVPVVEIRTADGRTGTGISGVHCGPELLCAVIDNYYAPALVGSSAADILGTWKRLYRLPTHWIGRAGAVHMALAMVDIALWDLAAQRAGVPLWRLLGGTADPVEAYNTDGGWLNFSVDELVRDLTSLIDQGWRRVKMKVGHPDGTAGSFPGSGASGQPDLVELIDAHCIQAEHLI